MSLKSNVLIPAMLVLGFTGPAWGTGFIAGSAPGQRPANAPTIKQHQITPEALGMRLHGVAEPLPNNVVAAALAGAWFPDNPYSHLLESMRCLVHVHRSQLQAANESAISGSSS